MSSKKQKDAAAKDKKQGTLFSFFKVIPKENSNAKALPSHPATSVTNRTVGSTSTTATSINKNSLPNKGNSNATITRRSSSSNANASASTVLKNNQSHQWDKIKLDMRLAVYWPDDKKYYPAVVKKERSDRSSFYVVYDDGETEWIDLRKEKFRFIDDEDDFDSDNDNDNDSETATKRASKNNKEPPKKRPRIHESDDEEFEMEMEDAPENDGDDEEEFEHDGEEEADDGEDEEEQWLVSDDDDDDELTTSTKKKRNTNSKRIKVTHHKGVVTADASSSKPAAAAEAPKTTPKTSKLSSNSSAAATTLTPTSLGAFSAFSQSSSQTNAPAKRVTPPSSTRSSVESIQFAAAAEGAAASDDGHNIAFPYVKGAANPAGSHMHNHLKFLKNPRDDQGRTKDHPDYDPRTLKVDFRELEKHNDGKKCTPAMEQWWEAKAQYFDTVLLFKTGKFYELHHMDADVGVQVCELQYMKGHAAHAGFPEVAYGTMADRLVRAGYKVARCEQTETQEMFQKRKKQLKGRNPPKVMSREVCSIVTRGTRTFCYLDVDMSSAVGQEGHRGLGPLLAIREVPVDADNTGEQDDGVEDADASVRPVCEYGIVAVDAARAVITIGQFADNVLRSRMATLLAAFAPSEILIEGGENGASPTLRDLLKSAQTTSPFLIEEIRPVETFPKSTAVDANVRRKLERNNGRVHPWDVEETLKELHRRQYFPRGSRQQQDSMSVSRWPRILRLAVEGRANLAISSLGAALYYLQRNLIDEEILSMGIVVAYSPPVSVAAPAGTLSQAADEDGSEIITASSETEQVGSEIRTAVSGTDEEQTIAHMSLDGNTLCQLEILTNSVDHKVNGSLWSKIDFTKTPHGARLLRAWLLRPLFRKAEIERRADAVEELLSGDIAMALNEAASLLAKCGDIERLLAKVHAMSGSKFPGADDESSTHHPSNRAVLYETKAYTKRKVGDFSKVLNGLRSASKIPELFQGLEIKSGFLKNILRSKEDGGCFPDISEDLNWFFNVCDWEKASNSEFEPGRGVDHEFDEACDAIDQIHSELERYKEEMCDNILKPRHVAKSSWKYINTAQDSKDKFTIELPNSVSVPEDFRMVGKRGNGAKQVNKYRSRSVEDMVALLERAIEVHKERKARQMQHIFAKFDEKRNTWAAVAQATALLDALGSLATLGNKPGYCRPRILDCPPDGNPCINIKQGRHATVETTGSGEFIPNDLTLGQASMESVGSPPQMVLLLSGCNMGGKSTLLRQTALICILAQIGGFVPAEECELTPVDNIMTRLGASDRILLGQSTFFVELAETAAALRGATRRSLLLFDELGRGTSSFDGTALASACLSYICKNLKCLSLFATHYHSLLSERMNDPCVRLGHMECCCEDDNGKDNITFLYTLGDGACPKSFGINVARLASLPEEILEKAHRISSEFELEMNGEIVGSKISPEHAVAQKRQLIEMIENGDVQLDLIENMWEALQ